MEADIPLDAHGWKGCYIPTDLRGFLKTLPTWRNLVILRPPETFSNRTLQFTWDSLTDASGNTFMPALHILSKLDEGTYGEVFRAQRALYKPVPNCSTRYQRIVDFHDVVSKQVHIHLSESEKTLPAEELERIYEDEIQAILYESALHVLVYHTMRREGFSTVIPQLYDVFGESDVARPAAASHIRSVSAQMELIEGETLHTYFKKAFQPSSYAEVQRMNDRLLLDILVQLCVYLDILQKKLRFNHRDLKVNNVLRRHHAGPWIRPLHHEYLKRPWICKNDLVLIDFGFSCVACDEPQRMSLIQAGSWFQAEHDCMKEGRDIALFLYCLHSCFPLEHRITPALWALIQDVMVASVSDCSTVSLLKVGIGRDGHPQSAPFPRLEFHAGIYKFLRRFGTEVPGCAPRVLLTRLEAFADGGVEKVEHN